MDADRPDAPTRHGVGGVFVLVGGGGGGGPHAAAWVGGHAPQVGYVALVGNMLTDKAFSLRTPKSSVWSASPD